MSDESQNFEAMKSRLDEIVEEVSAEGISLDEALALYEEAVKLGLAACDVSEADILVNEQAEHAMEANGDASEAAPSDAGASAGEADPSGAAENDGEAGANQQPASDETAPF